MSTTLRGMGESAQELVARLEASVGPAVFEPGVAPEWTTTDPRRETWIDLQSEVVDAAEGASPAERGALAAALLDAVLHQPSFGPSNRLTPEAFRLILAEAPEEVRRALGLKTVETMYGGLRYLEWHLWTVPGLAGADWLRELALADDVRANFLYQDMSSGKLPRWSDADWPVRLDVLAALPAEPRPGIVTMLAMSKPPREACPSLVRVVLAHGVDERDHLTRSAAAHIRAHRSGEPAADAGLFDWSAQSTRPELFRWLLELAGDSGTRHGLVEAAVDAGAITVEDGRRLAAPLERPAWADGEVPWRIAAVRPAGVVRLPDGRLTGGDPWWTGGAEGIPWLVELPRGAFDVTAIVASHPLLGQECAALHLCVGPERAASWTLIPTVYGHEGYHVEVGTAGLGSVAAYEALLVHDEPVLDEWLADDPPRWRTMDGGDAGSLVMCSVGPQHQLCRTWLGKSDAGEVVALVTDLGLIDLDPGVDPRLPWE